MVFIERKKVIIEKDIADYQENGRRHCLDYKGTSTFGRKNNVILTSCLKYNIRSRGFYFNQTITVNRKSMRLAIWDDSIIRTMGYCAEDFYIDLTK